MLYLAKVLPAVMHDFFAAGKDTTSNALNWAVLYLVHYPDVQIKLYEEVERIVGKSISSTLHDRNR